MAKGRSLSKARREEMLKFFQMRLLVAQSYNANAYLNHIELKQSEARYIISLIEKDLENASKKD